MFTQHLTSTPAGQPAEASSASSAESRTTVPSVSQVAPTRRFRRGYVLSALTAVMAAFASVMVSTTPANAVGVYAAAGRPGAVKRFQQSPPDRCLRVAR